VTQPATKLSVRWGSHCKKTQVSRHVAAVTRGAVVVAELCSSHSRALVPSAHLSVTAIASAKYDRLFAPFQDWAMVGAVVADSCGTGTLSKDGTQP
jgi:hypothetical protein